MKVALIILVLLVVAGGVAAGFAWSGREPEKPIVQMAEATTGELVVTITAPGEIRADKRVSLSARTSARIVELPFDEGDTVAAGDVLVRLDDVDARAAVRSAEASQRQAEASLAVARARLDAARAAVAVNLATLKEATLELERQQSLASSNDTTGRQVETAAAAVERIEAQVESERLQLVADEANLATLEAAVDAGGAGVERARQTLADTVIASPIAGVVTRVNAEVGELVIVGTMNNAGTVILEVADLSQMLCIANIDEANVTKVEVGQPATVRSSAYGDRELPGVVRNVALAKAEPTAGGAASNIPSGGGGTYEVEIVLDMPDDEPVKLFSGLTADVEIETTRLENVLLVPSQAVTGPRVDSLPAEARSHPSVDPAKAFTTVVWRVVDGVAKAAPVATGERDLTSTQIKDGVAAGDRVVVGPFAVFETIADGQAVATE